MPQRDTSRRMFAVCWCTTVTLSIYGKLNRAIMKLPGPVAHTFLPVRRRIIPQAVGAGGRSQAPPAWAAGRGGCTQGGYL